MSGDEQRIGDWRVICQRSGFKCWASETVLEPGTNLRVLRRFADVRNPQDFVKAVPERPIPWSSPEGPDVEVSTVTVHASDL